MRKANILRMQSDWFKDLLYARHTALSFDKMKAIPLEVVSDIMSSTTLAPSSFNLQPYKIVLVKSQKLRNMIASEAMLGSNGRRVENAPLTAIFLSHKDVSENLEMLLKMEQVTKKVDSLRMAATFLLRQDSMISKSLKRAAFHLLSPVTKSPMIPANLTAWSQKNTALACMVYMLAATAHGLHTAPMEGFDERRLCHILDIPMDRFDVPMIIATGYPDIENGEIKLREKVRFNLSDTCFVDGYGDSFKYRS